MEVVASLPTNTRGASGGTKKHVEEWSRLDHLTGMLEHARVEADHWASNTSNSRHHFGKVIDSRARNMADGSIQQQKQTKQLEVFQANIPGGSVQVIRSHTSTSSSWHNSKVLQNQSAHMDWPPSNNADKFSLHSNLVDFPMDSLNSNKVNLESEKSKASVGRLLPSRRPPTRSKLIKSTNEEEFFNGLSKICDEVHDETEKRLNSIAQDMKFSLNDSVKLLPPLTNGTNNDHGEHFKLEKKKSISDENLNIADEKENSDPWKRDSKARWSLQVPKTKFKNLESTVDLELVLKRALQQKGECVKPTVSEEEIGVSSSSSAPWKRKSFVTEKTLKEMKQKLRHLDSNECKEEIVRDEEPDDGICTESKGSSDKEDDRDDNELSVFHQDNETIATTGSLECRGKHKNEDWFDRRKSYGFEPVLGGTKNVSMKTSNLSTDSGICRSSELELSSTPIIKKLAEKNDKLSRRLNDGNEDFDTAKVGAVSELRSKFEKKSHEVKTNSSESNFENRRSGKVKELIKTLDQTTSNSSFDSKSNKNIFADPGLRSIRGVDQDLLLKRHSIACDDSKYISKCSSEESKPPNNIKATVVNLSNFECGDVPSAAPVNNISPSESTDVKKPKKVEFSKTEVHFAAAEPGKIKIVETDEKPPPANLHRRRKRSQSVSPKIGLPQTRFGDEKSPQRESGVEPVPPKESEIKDLFCGQGLTSTTCDNGLAVRILSTKPSDNRRASWSMLENVDNKSGFSTKVNFGYEGVTVVADVKSRKFDQFKNLESDLKTCDDGLDMNRGGKFGEKLIVRIGGSGGNTQSQTTTKYSNSRFTDSFRDSIQTRTDFSMDYREEKLKSTSLIIDTIKQSMRAKVQIMNAKQQYEKEMERKISDLRKKEKQQSVNLDQPSTYLMEMNKLQQRYRIKENRSVDQALLKDEKSKSRIYNTIPTGKNGFSRSKTIMNDLPSVLSAFDTLYQSIDEAIEENRKTIKCKDCDKLVQHTNSKFKKYSSQSSFLQQFIADQDDGNLSDDSLKADQEVRSYMSTAILEEYENELSGSWSRRRYRKHAKQNDAKEAEISEKSHFKPLRSMSDEEKLKTVTNSVNVDIKKPKITSVAVNLTAQSSSWNEDKLKNNANNKNCTTVLLNKPAILRNEIGDPSIANERVKVHDTSLAKQRIYENTKNDGFRITTTVRSVPKLEPDYKNVKIIRNQMRTSKSRSPDVLKKDGSKPRVNKDNVDTFLVSNGSIRRKPNQDRGRLFDSGRDSWLNLPKERKPIVNDRKIYGECTKLRPTLMKKPSTNEEQSKGEKGSSIRKAVAQQLNINGFTDASSEEDAHRRSFRKPFSKPLMTISEKVSLKMDPKTSACAKISNCKLPVMRTTSNSSLESHSNSFEFRTPVLKTEERSRRRAARLMQRASCREALLNAKSSSEDITSDNEMNLPRSSKVKSPKKNKSSKLSKAEQTLLSNSSYNRLIQQKSAKMEINIFNFRDKRNCRTDNRLLCSKSQPPHSNTITLSETRRQGLKETDVKSVSKVEKISRSSVGHRNNRDVHGSSNQMRAIRTAVK